MIVVGAIEIVLTWRDLFVSPGTLTIQRYVHDPCKKTLLL